MFFVGILLWGCSDSQSNKAEVSSQAAEKPTVGSLKDSLIEKSKDLAAAAVLICSIGAAVVGLIIFLPKIQELLLK